MRDTTAPKAKAQLNSKQYGILPALCIAIQALPTEKTNVSDKMLLKPFVVLAAGVSASVLPPRRWISSFFYS